MRPDCARKNLIACGFRIDFLCKAVAGCRRWPVVISRSLGHVFILDPNIPFTERTLFEFIDLDLDATSVKHFRNFAKVLVDSAQSLKELPMQLLGWRERASQILYRLEPDL